MSSKTIDFGNLESLTKPAFQALVDNIFYDYPLIRRLTEKKMSFDGGAYFHVPLRSGSVSGGGFKALSDATAEYNSNYDALTIASSKIRADIVVPTDVEMDNSGPAQIANFINTEFENAKDFLQKIMAAGIFCDGTGTTLTWTDATLGSTTVQMPTPIYGLQYWVADDPTTGTVAGINRATDSWFRNYYVSDALNLSSLTLTHIDTDMKGCTFGGSPSAKPDLIVTSKAIHSKIKTLIGAQNSKQITINTDTGKGGFEDGLFYEGAEIIWDPLAPTGSIYYLNTNFTQLYMDKNGFSRSPFFWMQDQMGQIQRIYTSIQLVCSRPSSAGVRSNITEGS